MKDSEKTMWGIHAGKMAEADSLFLKKDCIAIGWVQGGDFSVLPNEREAFKEKLTQTYPEKKKQAIAISAGQIYRFVHIVNIGDLVIYPSKVDRQIHIGEITGKYSYEPDQNKDFPQTRTVKWLKSFPRTSFSQGALYEVGSALTLFQVKNYADEYFSALEGKEIETEGEDETVGIVAEEIEEITNDFILKRLATEIKGKPFEEFVGHLLNQMGYKTRLAAEGIDGGIDIIAHKDELGFEPPIIKVQIKSTEGSVGDPATSALYGKVGVGEFGLLFTLGTFTKQAINFAKEKTNLRLIDGRDLVQLILLHYQTFDSKYKGLIPLKRVFIPESLDEG